MEDSKLPFLIDANKRFNFLNPTPQLIKKNCPESVFYDSCENQDNGNMTLTYTLNIDKSFLQRSVSLFIPTIPLIVTRSVVIPGSTYDLENFFNKYDTVCLKQFSFVNAIDTMTVSLDGTSLPVCQDIAEQLKIESQYYRKEDLHKYFSASLPDLYIRYSDYSIASGFIDTQTIDSPLPIKMKVPILSSENIFGSLSQEYSTRIPMITSDTTFAAATKVANINLCDMKCLLPMGLFSTPGDVIPLYNVQKMLLKITLKPNWWTQLFSLGDTTISAINFDTSKFDKFRPRLEYTKITPPAYIESKSNLYRSMMMNLPTHVKLPGYEQQNITIATNGKFHRNFNMNEIPKRIFIYAKGLYKTSDSALPLREAMLPDIYGRIESLTLRTTNSSTNFGSNCASRLFAISKQNGLTRSFESLYLAGHATCIDFSSDISLKTNTLIGTQPGNQMPTLTVDATVRNIGSEEITYELCVIAVYDTVLKYDGVRWAVVSSGDLEKDIGSYKATDDILYESTIQNSNMIGSGAFGGNDLMHGSGLFDMIKSAITNVLPGIWNVGKALISNKDGLYDTLVKNYEGKGQMHSNTNNVSGGSVMDNYTPVGGNRGGRPITSWYNP